MSYGRLLLTDNDRNMRALLYELLAGAGFLVTCTTESGLSYTMLSKKNADAAILGISSESGYIHRMLSKSGASSEIPIIVMLPEESSAKRLEYLNLGADEVITKPVDIAELTAKLRSMLRRDLNASIRCSPSATVSLGGLSVDMVSYTVTVDGKKIPLPPKEIEILYLLLTNPERVFRRGEIAARVWGQNLANDRTVDSHVSRIKHLIGEPYSSCIVSVRGVGYKLELRDIHEKIIAAGS